ncbi:ribosomal protein S18-alanine N-acetyltransferase [Arthrobacter sp. HLT1-20]
MSTAAGAPAQPSPAVLRAMEPGDIDFITALDAQLFGVDCWPRHMFEDELAQPETRKYIIAEVPDASRHPQIAGYAGLMCVEPVGDIQTIGVLPEFEGRGIARAMMASLIAEAALRGAKEIMLEVSSANPRAQDLYKRNGFEHIHTRRKYYRDGSDGLIMRLTLPAPTDVKDPS